MHPKNQTQRQFIRRRQMEIVSEGSKPAAIRCCANIIARCKVNGNPVRPAFETHVFTTAKLRLPDKVKESRKPKATVGTFADGRLSFDRRTRSNHSLAQLSRICRLNCVTCTRKSWAAWVNGRRARSIRTCTDCNGRCVFDKKW